VEAIFIPVCGPSSPTDPACPPEALSGLTITVRSPNGGSVATMPTSDDGTAIFEVAPGDYVIDGSEEARAITPSPEEITVGAGDHLTVRLTYASALQ
jgi:hypothetical protein